MQAMDFGLTENQRELQNDTRELAAEYDDAYWREVRTDRRFPDEFYGSLADAGLLGIAVPKEYGGEGHGISELVLALESLGEAGAWIGAISVLAGPVFGGHSVLEHGSERQRERYLPSLVDGTETWALAVTEADAGLNTARISTTARREGDEFVIDGTKQFISGLDHADQMLLLARTTPLDEVNSPLEGLTLFVTNPDADAVDYDEIPLDIYYPERTYEIEIEGLRVPETQVLGVVDQGLHHLLPTLNLERVAIGTCSWGAGRSSLDAAITRARDREVWSEPIGGHQAIQHPLADAHADLETARLALRKAAWCIDRTSKESGETANVANLKACESAWNACEAAMVTFGGTSVAAELGIAAAWGFVRHTRSVPVSEQMIRNFIGQHALDLPRSY